MTATTAPPSNTVTLTINGVAVTAPKGMLLVEAAKLASIEVPVFCYHSRLKPVGACRMCLVEIEKMPRLQTACTTPVAEGMVVKSASDAAIAGQSAVVSMLLANHPLDCPVCDKGGECPLQDNTFKYGSGVSRFEEEKRHKDKAYELSDKIVLDKERCILCYRCVRFHDEIPGDRQLTVVDRGAAGEIDVPEGSTYDSIFQGNVTDICPVGALTSRQYRFRARPWDLQRTPTVCTGCAVGCNVEAHARDGRVLRLVPRENVDVNDVWLCDRGRYGTPPAERDARLATPLVRDAGSTLRAATWAEALTAAGRIALRPSTCVVLAPSLTNEALAVAGGPLRFLLEGSGARFAVAPRAASLWPTQGAIKDVPKAKVVITVGLDVWNELPILALPIRKAVLAGAKLVVIGKDNGLHRDTHAHLVTAQGDERAAVHDLLAALDGKGSSPASQAAAALVKGALTPGAPVTLLVGMHTVADPEGLALARDLARALGADGAQGLVGAPSLAANGAGALQIVPDLAAVDPHGKSGVLHDVWQGNVQNVVLIGDTGMDRDTGRARVVLMRQGLLKDEVYGDGVDVVLPLCHPYEQQGSMTNLEGRVQHMDAAGIPLPGMRPDFAAIAQLSSDLGSTVPQDVRALRKHLAATHPFFGTIRAPSRGLRLA